MGLKLSKLNDTPDPPPPPGQTTPLADGYCCGRYGCYWNAFLFAIIFVENCMKIKMKKEIGVGVRYPIVA